MEKVNKSYLVIFIFYISIFADIKAGLIFSGVDTLNSRYWQGYFDFFQGRPCTSEVDYDSYDFQEHLAFQSDYPNYELIVSGSNMPCIKDLGKINLDSIKKAPPDSELVDDNGGGLYRVFDVTPDSLNSLIGTAYIIKTATNIRDDYPMYAKIKILDFTIIDSANHEVEMVFLWVCNLSGYSDLTTENPVDTFSQTQIIVSDIKKSALQSNKRRIKTVFKVVGNRINIPEHLVGKVRFAEIYDLRGRLLGRVEVGKAERVVDVRGVVGAGAVAVVNIYK